MMGDTLSVLGALAASSVAAVLVLVGCGSDGPEGSNDGSAGDRSGGRDSAGEHSGVGGDGSGGAQTGTGGVETGSSGGMNTGGSSATGGAPTASEVYGDVFTGQYHLGPVDFAESQWHNACAPGGGYRSELRDATGLGGEFLAGVSYDRADGGTVCDACIRITTGTGRSIVARVVTYGATNAPGDLDVSPSVYAALNTEEYPRSMSWQFARCPETGPLSYEFQTEASAWWSSFWVRNPRVPLVNVEVKSANHADFAPLRRESDGTLNDDGGFGEGEFTLRLTAMDGQVITDTFAGFSTGELITSNQQFE